MRATELVREVRRLKELLRARPGEPVGFVPTMGALHRGHLALVEAATAESSRTVVSIFVNPLQFGPGEDYERYPRQLEQDLALLSAWPVELVFAPEVSELYPKGAETFVEVQGLSGIFEGEVRPGHFRGVTTVVAKLLHLVGPDRVYFGQKDWQQTVVVRRMLADLFWPVTLRVLPTVREPDGLALSSRNAYLGPEERRRARVLFEALTAGKAAICEGERAADVIRRRIEAVLGREPWFRPDYVAVVDADTLRPLTRLAGHVCLAVAGRLGSTRLIDNLVLQVTERQVREEGGAGWTYVFGA